MRETLILATMWTAMLSAPSLLTAQAVVDKNSVTGVIISPCGEAINYVGDFHTVSHVSTDGAGGQHIDGLLLFSAKGVGQITGDSYSINQVFPFSLEIKGAFTLTSVQKITINHHGGGASDDYFVNGLSHLSADSNGVVTAFVDNLTFGCR